MGCMLFVVFGELLEHWLTTLRVRGTIQPGRCVPISDLRALIASDCL